MRKFNLGDVIVFDWEGKSGIGIISKCLKIMDMGYTTYEILVIKSDDRIFHDSYYSSQLHVDTGLGSAHSYWNIREKGARFHSNKLR